jgi:hypothetical protein
MNINMSRALVPMQTSVAVNGPVPVSKSHGVNLYADDRSHDTGRMRFIGYGSRERHRLYGPSGRASMKNIQSGNIIDLYV